MRTKLVLTKQSLMWGLTGVWKVDLHVNPHEYIRGEPAKLLTLFHPKTGRVVGKGVKKYSNAVLHPWLKEQLDEITKNLLAESKNESDEERRQSWTRWQEGLKGPFTLPKELPPLKMVMILDNLAGHGGKDEETVIAGEIEATYLSSSCSHRPCVVVSEFSLSHNPSVPGSNPG